MTEHIAEASGLGQIEAAKRLAEGMEHIAEVEGLAKGAAAAVEQPKHTADAEVVGIEEQAWQRT